MVKDRMKLLDSEKNKQYVLTTLQALSHITRQVGSKLPMLYAPLVNQLSNIPVAILNPQESNDDDNEIAEAALQAIENLIKKCPAEAKDSIRAMYKLTFETIKYDPNFDDAGDQDED
jgi:cullin-associated NEDD8-dissociated protein 1